MCQSAHFSNLLSKFLRRIANRKSYEKPNLVVRKRPGRPAEGLIQYGRRVIPCAVGRSGIGRKCREGDGRTPIGAFSILSLFHRADRCPLNHNAIRSYEIKDSDGWCDAVGDRNYNRLVRLPYGSSHERLRRDDHLYDVFWVLDFNIRQRLTRGGSAIFFHLAHNDYKPTEGCIAVSKKDMAWLLQQIRPNSRVIVKP